MVLGRLLTLIHDAELDCGTNVHLHWGCGFNHARHSHLEDIVDMRVLDQIQENVALSTALSLQSHRGVVVVKLGRNDARVGQLEGHLDAFDVVSELVALRILELQGDCHLRTEREVQGLIHVLAGERVDICDEHIEHDDLVVEGLALFHDHCHLAVLVECLDALLIDEGDDGSLHILVLVGVGRVIVDALLAVSQSEFGLSVGLNLRIGVRRHHVEVSLCLWFVDELRDVDLELVPHTDSNGSREPVLLILILLRVFNGQLEAHEDLARLASRRVHSRTVKEAQEYCIVIVGLVISDLLVGDDEFQCAFHFVGQV